jgi:hypothetical protein
MVHQVTGTQIRELAASCYKTPLIRSAVYRNWCGVGVHVHIYIYVEYVCKSLSHQMVVLTPCVGAVLRASLSLGRT